MPVAVLVWYCAPDPMPIGVCPDERSVFLSTILNKSTSPLVTSGDYYWFEKHHFTLSPVFILKILPGKTS